MADCPSGVCSVGIDMLRMWAPIDSGKQIRTIFTAVALCAFGALISGCAGTGTATTDGSAASAPTASAPAPAAPAQTATPTRTGPAPAGQTRLTLTRVEGILYAGAPATVKVNSQKAAELWAEDLRPSIFHSATTWSPSKRGPMPEPGPSISTPRRARPTRSKCRRGRRDYGPSLFGPLGAAAEGAGTKNAGAFQMRVVSQ